MLDTLVAALWHLIEVSKENALFALGFVGFFVLVHFINRILRYRLNFLGVYPRSYGGLVGIFFSPFLHKDFNHLFFNSIPLFVLTNLLLVQGRDNFFVITFVIIFFSGLATWIFGKKAIHIGASSLIMGYFGFLMTNAYFDWSLNTVILAVLSFYYLGGLLILLMPSGEKGVSWAGHFWGFAVGVGVAYFYPYIIGAVNVFANL